VNRDASLYLAAHASGRSGRHASDGHDGSPGSAGQSVEPFVGEPAHYSRRRSRPCPGRSNCKPPPGDGNSRTRTDGPIAVRLAPRRRRGMDEYSHSQDVRPACVPGTVWGTPPMLSRQVVRGAVLATKLWQALAALSFQSSNFIRAHAQAGGCVPSWPLKIGCHPSRAHRQATPAAGCVRILTDADNRNLRCQIVDLLSGIHAARAVAA
jgi:hypothetical protein